MVCVHHNRTGDNVGLCDHCGSPSAQAKLNTYIITVISQPEFKCPRDDELCQDCYNSAAGAFRSNTYRDGVVSNIKAMKFKDWCVYVCMCMYIYIYIYMYTHITHMHTCHTHTHTHTRRMTVVLTSGVIGLAIAREINEIILCELTRLRFSQESSCIVWTCLEHVNAFLRRFLLLPLVLMSAVCLVVGRGGDALSVCFNALALVFLLECDNLLYDNVLDDYTRDLVHDEGWVEIDDTAADFLAVTKFAHFVALSIGIPVCIVIAYAITELDTFSQILLNALSMYVVFPVIAIMETQLRMRVQAGGRCRAIIVVVCKTCLGTYSRFISISANAHQFYLSPV